MSPLAEKLAAVLADWDQLSATLSEAQKQITAKDETIASLRHQLAQVTTHQAVQAAEMREKVNELEEKVACALLTTADPDDAKLMSWIDRAYTTLGSKIAAPAAAPAAADASAAKSTTGSGSVEKMAVALSSPVSSPPDMAPSGKTPAAASTGSSSRPGRSAAPAAAPVAQTPSLRDVVFKLVE